MMFMLEAQQMLIGRDLIRAGSYFAPYTGMLTVEVYDADAKSFTITAICKNVTASKRRAFARGKYAALNPQGNFL